MHACGCDVRGYIIWVCIFVCGVWMCVDYIYGTSLKIAEPFYFIFIFFKAGILCVVFRFELNIEPNLLNSNRTSNGSRSPIINDY